MGIDHKRKSGHWAAKCKLDSSREFASKGIPFERPEGEQQQHELQELKRFFDVEDEDAPSLAVTFATMAFSSLASSVTAPAAFASTAPAAFASTAPAAFASTSEEERGSKTSERREGSVPEQSLKLPEDSEVNAVSDTRWKWRALKWKAIQNNDEDVELSSDVVPTMPSPTSPTDPPSENRFFQQKPSTRDTMEKSSPSTPISEKKRSPATSWDMANKTCESQSCGSHSPKKDLSVSFTENDMKEIDFMSTGEDDSPRRNFFSVTTGQLRKRIHRPVTTWELVEARTPQPISIGDFPPIVRRQPEHERPQESHYDYFTRKIPTESPEHRRAMQWRAETTRKSYINPTSRCQETYSQIMGKATSTDTRAASAKHSSMPKLEWPFH